MILHRYVARRFLGSFVGVAAAFAGILAMIDLIEQVRRFDGEDVGLPRLLALTALSVPETLYRILPLVVILATLALFLSLSRSSEMVVTRAAGRSALRTLLAPLIVAALIGLAAVAVLNPVVAATSLRYEALAQTATNAGTSALSISQEGLWLRQGDRNGQVVIRAGRANPDGSILYNVDFFGFDAGGAPAFRIETATARLVPGAWILAGAKEWRLSNPNPEASAVVRGTMRLPSDLTANRILDSFATPSAIPIWELPRFIERLEQAGFSARVHRVWLQSELSLPLLLCAMVLIGAGFTMRHTRFARTGVMVLLALAMGFGLFFARNFAQIMGENGQIPVLLATWGPPVAAILLPIGLLLHWEDG